MLSLAEHRLNSFYPAEATPLGYRHVLFLLPIPDWWFITEQWGISSCVLIPSAVPQFALQTPPPPVGVSVMSLIKKKLPYINVHNL